jgi:hypothetical protein
MAAITRMQSQGELHQLQHRVHVCWRFKDPPLRSQALRSPQQIRSLRHLSPRAALIKPTGANKSDLAKDAQLARFKERIKTLEEHVKCCKKRMNCSTANRVNDRATSRTHFRKNASKNPVMLPDVKPPIIVLQQQLDVKEWHAT